MKSQEQQCKEFVEFINNNNVRTKDAIEMHLADEPFKKIKSGEKTVEIRLYDEKRKALKIGDEIIFYKGGERAEWIAAKVIGLYRFDKFIDLFKSDLSDKTGCGKMSPKAAARCMYKYYTKEQERQYGVLAIEVKLK